MVGGGDTADRFRRDFGAALDAQLRSRRLTRKGLAATTNVTVAWVSKMSRDGASPKWVDIIADATGASDEERVALHRAAARAKGFRID